MILDVPSPAHRRGACPTLDRPMATGDGLLARIRVPAGQLTPAQMRGIAEASLRYGNGLVEITSRGNLQVRGLVEATVAGLADAVRRLVPIETGLVVDESPLAGEDPEELRDTRAMAQAIRDGADRLADRLAPKMSVVVDGRGQVSLDSLKADIRLRARPEGGWDLTLGATRPLPLDDDSALTTTLATLSALAALGTDARAADLFSGRDTSPSGGARPLVGSVRRRSGGSVGIALPFSSAAAPNLIALMLESERLGVGKLRLAPAHGLLLDDAPLAMLDYANGLGFVTDPADPILRVDACPGSEGCRSGLIPARQIAAELAPRLGPADRLHVSGCAKGCAHPGPAPRTLVGVPGGIGLVNGGKAGDTPAQIVARPDLHRALAEMQDRA